MNTMKCTTIFIVTSICLLLQSIVWAADKNFSGSWEYVESVDGTVKPYSTFELNLDEASDGVVTGSYCFITQSGNRIDCDADGTKNIIGHVAEGGRYANVTFYSFFGAKGGVANLLISNDMLTWKTTRSPVGHSFYGPYTVTLTRKQPDKHQGERQVVVDKAYLYPLPEKTSVKTYVVKGEYVTLISVSKNLKFWKISYRSKAGTEMERWIDCNAINFCP